MYYILYLLALSGILFVIRDAAVLSGLLALQLLLWWRARIPFRRFRLVFRRIGLFLLLAVAAYAFAPTGGEQDIWYSLSLATRTLPVNLSGLWLALLMCGRIVCLVLASTWVQHCAAPETFLAGLQRFGVPRHVAITIRHAMAMLGGATPRLAGHGRQSKQDRYWQGSGQQDSGRRPQLRRILKGDLRVVRKLMDWAFEQAERRLGEYEPGLDPCMRSEIAVMLSMTLAMMSFKMIVLMPGLLVAPGHKNVILLPLFLIAAQRSRARLGGMWTGLCMGVINVMLGFGKLGILELVQFMLTGLLADMLLPFYCHAGRIAGTAQLAVIGAFMGLARFSTNLLLLLLAGAPLLGFAILAPVIGAQVLFGALSAAPARLLLKPPVNSP